MSPNAISGWATFQSPLRPLEVVFDKPKKMPSAADVGAGGNPPVPHLISSRGKENGPLAMLRGPMGFDTSAWLLQLAPVDQDKVALTGVVGCQVELVGER